MWWSFVGNVSFLEVFLDQDSFHLRHPFWHAYFFEAFTQLLSQTVLDGREFFLKSRITEFHHSIAFSNWVFFSVLLWASLGICPPQSFLSVFSLSPCNSFLILFIHLAFLLYPFCFYILHQNCFCFFCIHLLVYASAFSTDFLVEFSFVILEGPTLLVLLDPVPASFESPIFRKYFLIYFLPVVLSVLSVVVFYRILHSTVPIRVFHFLLPQFLN